MAAGGYLWRAKPYPSEMETCGGGAKPGGIAPTTLFGAIPGGERSRLYQFRLGIETRVFRN